MKTNTLKSILGIWAACAAFFIFSPGHLQAQVFVMGNGQINACSGTLLDPGGVGNYPANAFVTQTICSGTGECVSLSFTQFNLEDGFDFLLIYDGPSTASPLLGIYTGNSSPGTITGSTNSSGCLTLVFESDDMFQFAGFSATINCTTCGTGSGGGAPNSCANAAPFCTNAGNVTFPASTNTLSEPGYNYGCLITQPNPAWYYLKIATPGQININMFSSPSFDIDFIIWGPFASLNGVCTPANLSGQNIVDCSYSTAAVENAIIPNAQVGEYYIFLITNFSNQPTNINFGQTNANQPGAGSTDCTILCTVNSITLIPGPCDPATNTYNLNGIVQFENNPQTGNLLITNSAGGNANVALPVASPYNFVISNLPSNGSNSTVTVSFSEDGTCFSSQTYTAPTACSDCSITASFSSACEGQNLQLNGATTGALPGATYSWTGPNGFTSNLQNPILPNANASMNGNYTVVLTSGVCNAQSTVNVTINPNPAAPNFSTNSPVCEGQSLSLSTPVIAGAAYNWTTPSGVALLNAPNVGISPTTAADAGNYSLSVTINGCTSEVTINNVLINPSPPAPTVSSNSPICEGEDLSLFATGAPGATYAWTGPNGFLNTSATPVIANAPAAASGTYSAVVTLNGCPSPVATVDVSVVAIPATPVLAAATPFCEGTPISITAQTYTEPVSYSWIGPNGFTSINNAVAIPSAASIHQGNFQLIVTITNTTCASAPGNIEIEVIPAPVANAGADASVCSGVQIGIGSPAAAGVTYAWSPTAGLNNPALANPALTLSNPGTTPLVVTYTVTATLGNCSTTDATQITINPQPVASITSPAPQCFNGNNFSFSAEGSFTPSAIFLWTFGPLANQQTSTQRNPNNIQFGGTGQFPISLTITDNGCASNIANGLVTIYEMPVANFTVDNFNGCDPLQVQFTNLSSIGNGTLTFNWEFGNGQSSSAFAPSTIYTAPGSYTVRLKANSNQGCSDLYTITNMITVRPTPKAGFSISPIFVDIVDPTVSFEDQSQNADMVAYFISDLDILFEFNPRYTFSDTGTYQIVQVASNQFGCSDTSIRFVVVDLGYKIYAPSAFTPNNDGKNDFFRVFGEDVRTFEMFIFNRWGQQMFHSFDINSGWDGTIRLTDKIAPNDIYIYTIKATDKYGRQYELHGTVNLIK